MRIFCKRLRRNKLPKLTTFSYFFQLPHSAMVGSIRKIRGKALVGHALFWTGCPTISQFKMAQLQWWVNHSVYCKIVVLASEKNDLNCMLTKQNTWKTTQCVWCRKSIGDIKFDMVPPWGPYSGSKISWSDKTKSIGIFFNYLSFSSIIIIVVLNVVIQLWICWTFCHFYPFLELLNLSAACWPVCGWSCCRRGKCWRPCWISETWTNDESVVVVGVVMMDSVLDVETAFLLHCVKDKPVAVWWHIRGAGLFTVLPFLGWRGQLWFNGGHVTISDKFFRSSQRVVPILPPWYVLFIQIVWCVLWNVSPKVFPVLKKSDPYYIIAFLQLALFCIDRVGPVKTSWVLLTCILAVLPGEDVRNKLCRPQTNQQSSPVCGDILVANALVREQFWIWAFLIRRATRAGAFTPTTLLRVEIGVQGPTIWVAIECF